MKGARIRVTTISCVALGFCVVACATPQNIKDKSAASAALYADLSAAHRTYLSALTDELHRRDLLEAQIAVRTGDKRPQLEKPLAIPADTQQVLQSLRALGLQIDTSRLVHGVVDRFLRIDVVDPDDIADVSSQAASAFKEK
jgi:hypothetical protein